jgi:restriction system protein
MIVTYNPSRRVYLVGEVTGPYRYDTSVDPEDAQFRPVRWHGEVSRDLLSVESRNSLGSISTLFRISNEVAAELKKAMTSGQSAKPEATAAAEAIEDDLFKSMESRAREFIKDKVNALTWDDMQELVAGLLRSLGYKTRVSEAGPDRGKDIVASQRNLLEQGQVYRAFLLDAVDARRVASLSGDPAKYDDAIAQATLYANCLRENGIIR